MGEEKYIRVTDVVDYLICPRKVYLKRILGLSEETKEEMLLGKITHEVFELLNKKEKDIIYSILEPLSFDQIYNLYRSKVLEIIDQVIDNYLDEISNLKLDKTKIKIETLNNIEFEIYDRAKNVYSTMAMSDVYGIELWDSLFPKILSEVEVLSEKERLVGRIDRIEDYGEFIVPVEIKTSNSKKSLYLHKVQLALYKFLLFENFPRKKVGPAYIYYVKLRERKEVKIGNNFIRRVLEIKNKAREIIEEEKDPGIISKNRCKRCFFYKFCYNNNI